MNIQFQGFELALGGNAISWHEYLAHLLSVSNREVFYSPFNRILCMDTEQNDSFIVGLFVSIKDQKRFCEIREAGGDFALVARDLDPGARMADFNFFILNKLTCRGLFQYYHQSCSLRQFIAFMEKQFIILRGHMVEAAEAELNEGRNVEARIEALKAAMLGGEVLVRPETFEQLIEELDDVTEIRFDVSTFDDDAPFFTPFRNTAKKRTERVLFNRGMVDAIKRGVRQVARRDELSNVRVTGFSGVAGVEKTIRLFDNVTDFGQYDYDELTEHLAVNLQQFTRSRILTLLLETAGDNEHIFG